MKTKLNKTIRYANKLCHYVDIFIVAWNNELEYTDDLYFAARKADLIAYILGLEFMGLQGLAGCEWSRITDTKQQEKRSIEAHIKNGQTPYPSRLDRLEILKEQALAIKGPIKEVEIGPMSQLKPQQNDIQEALKLISEMLKIYEVAEPTPDSNAKGLMLNNLALKMGLMSKYRDKAASIGLVSRSSMRQPHDGIRPMPGIIADALGYSDTKRQQEILIHWQAKLEKLINKTSKDITAQAHPQQTPVFKPSPDFRNITATVKLALTEDQANCIKFLWEAKQKGIDELSGDYILVETGIVDKNFKKKMKDVFKNSPAWNTLIVTGSKRGNYRLVI